MSVDQIERKNTWIHISNTPILTLSSLALPWVYLGEFIYFLPIPNPAKWKEHDDVCFSNWRPDLHPVSTGWAILIVKIILKLVHLGWETEAVQGYKFCHCCQPQPLHQNLHEQPRELNLSYLGGYRILLPHIFTVHSYWSVLMPKQSLHVSIFTPCYFPET